MAFTAEQTGSSLDKRRREGAKLDASGKRVGLLITGGNADIVQLAGLWS